VDDRVLETPKSSMMTLMALLQELRVLTLTTCTPGGLISFQSLAQVTPLASFPPLHGRRGFMMKCDTIDKVKDGIIEDPTLCDFDPSALLCGGNMTENCLSQEQVIHVSQVYSDYKYPSGEMIFPAMQPGSEIGAADGLYAGAAFRYSEVCHQDDLLCYLGILMHTGLVQICCLQ
jgi:hypothetical protein